MMMSCLSNDRALSYKYIHIIYTYMHTSPHHLSIWSNPAQKKKSKYCTIDHINKNEGDEEKKKKAHHIKLRIIFYQRLICTISF